MFWTITGLVILLATFLSAAHDHQDDEHGNPSMDVLFHWQHLEYKFPLKSDRQYATDRGLFTERSGIPMDIGVEYNEGKRNRVFTTIPRSQLDMGIPFTLAMVTGKSELGGPILKPYPHYFWHFSQGGHCYGMTSVTGIAIDTCNQIWILDSGKIGNIQHCPPSLFTFDLTKDVLVNRYVFPEDQYNPKMSLFTSPVVDVRSTCNNTMVYIADRGGNGLLVYDALNGTSWRVEHDLFKPEPKYSTVSIAGTKTNITTGIYSISLTPKRIKGTRYLYFHALSSHSQNRVPLATLDNRTLWEMIPPPESKQFETIGSRDIQCTIEAMDSKGRLFCGLTNSISIVAWNSTKPFNKELFQIATYDPETLQFVDGMRVVRNKHNREELWVLSNKRHIFNGKNATGEYDINFRIMACKIKDLLNGKECNVSI